MIQRNCSTVAEYPLIKVLENRTKNIKKKLDGFCWFILSYHCWESKYLTKNKYLTLMNIENFFLSQKSYDLFIYFNYLKRKLKKLFISICSTYVRTMHTTGQPALPTTRVCLNCFHSIQTSRNRLSSISNFMNFVLAHSP